MKRLVAQVVSIHVGAKDKLRKDERPSIEVALDGIVGDRHQSYERSTWQGDKQAEGTVGLQRTFLARGARSVLVSLWSVSDAAFDWANLIENKDKEIKRLEGVYENLLQSNGVTVHRGRATLTRALAWRRERLP